jgi:hypothetical protein
MNVPSFPPPCTNHDWCTDDQDGGGRTGIQYAPEIIDYLLIPKTLPAGEYVLGWRWDCEQSNQIWQSCSDVTITE